MPLHDIEEKIPEEKIPMRRRKIVEIDEDLCDGCGLCVDACHEGAIQLVDGKARLVSDILCDGFGDCLGECPQDAITITEREAEPYSQEAVDTHLSRQGAGAATRAEANSEPTNKGALPVMGGCPGAASQQLQPAEVGAPAPGSSSDREPPRAAGGPAARPSALRNWPVQLHLAPVQAPYFEGAKLLIAADCVPFAHADFHEGLLAGRTLLVGCPKLDDTSAYLEKLAAIFRFNSLSSVEIAYMEVPCCRGLVMLVQQALEAAGKAESLRPTLTRIGIRGEVLESQ